MELLYFIGGILTVGVLYGLNLLRTVKLSHTELLARYQSQSNISSIQRVELEESLEDVRLMIIDIQKQMEKDQYENLSSINKRVSEMDKILSDVGVKITRMQDETENVVNRLASDIVTVRNNIKGLSEDPNFLNRY